jgi:hypothetical protein
MKGMLGPMRKCHMDLTCNKLLKTNNIWTHGTWTLTNLKGIKMQITKVRGLK